MSERPPEWPATPRAPGPQACVHKTCLVQRSRLFQKDFPLRRQCDRRDRDGRARRRNLRRGGRSVLPAGARRHGRAGWPGLDMGTRRTGFRLAATAPRPADGEHRLAGLARQALLAQLARLVRPAGIEGGRGATTMSSAVCLFMASRLYRRMRAKVSSSAKATIQYPARPDLSRAATHARFRGHDGGCAAIATVCCIVIPGRRAPSNPESHFRVHRCAMPRNDHVIYCAASSASSSTG